MILIIQEFPFYRPSESVTPANSGVSGYRALFVNEIPAFAGMTVRRYFAIFTECSTVECSPAGYVSS